VQEVRLNIGKIGISMHIENDRIRKRVFEHYRDFLAPPNTPISILINVHFIDFKRPNLDRLIYKTRSCYLGKKKNGWFFYSPSKTGASSLALFDSNFEKIEFYTQDPTGQLLLYLFPEVLFSLILPKYQSLLLHACGVMDGKKGYLFVAPAEEGKSTIAKLALKLGLKVLNDDRVIIRKEKNLFRIYGNPWHGEVEETSNKSLKIKRIFFLKKSKFNQIEPMSKKEAMEGFLKNSFFIPINNEMIKKRIDICFDLTENLNCYKLSFKPDETIWRFLDGYFK